MQSSPQTLGKERRTYAIPIPLGGFTSLIWRVDKSRRGEAPVEREPPIPAPATIS
jgi:hypothetical protein